MGYQRYSQSTLESQALLRTMKRYAVLGMLSLAILSVSGVGNDITDEDVENLLEMMKNDSVDDLTGLTDLDTQLSGMSPEYLTQLLAKVAAMRQPHQDDNGIFERSVELGRLYHRI